MNANRFLAAAALSMAITACSGGLHSDAPAEQIYVLHAAPGATPVQAPVQGVLLVPRPKVQPGLDTTRIVLARSGNELDFFSGSSWGESLPRVLEALTVESLRTSAGFSTVLGEAQATVRGDYELLLTARHFEAQYASMDAAPRARVVFECVLTSGTPRRVLGRCDAEAGEWAAGNRMSEIVAALEHAAQAALTRAGAQAAELARGASAKK